MKHNFLAYGKPHKLYKFILNRLISRGSSLVNMNFLIIITANLDKKWFIISGFVFPVILLAAKVLCF